MANIVFIDDDFASELIVENFRHRGHDVRRVASIDEAMDDLGSIARSDLVILDLIMPHSGTGPKDAIDGARSTGMLVFKELRKLSADLRILVFTANQDPGLMDVVRADPRARYMSRWSSPSMREFAATVHDMLGAGLEAAPPRPFIVHGHDEATKWAVKNYLQNTLGLPEPIILHEEPSAGRTIIEKFEDLAATAELAFVILTPDDRMAVPSDIDAEKRRARQNVILELGFFLAALGRRTGRVFLLYKGPLELPSDLSGVIYIDIGMGLKLRANRFVVR